MKQIKMPFQGMRKFKKVHFGIVNEPSPASTSKKASKKAPKKAPKKASRKRG